jgi:hypothetical protein
VCVILLGANISSGKIEILNRHMSVARNLALMLADLAASTKVLPKLCLTRVTSVL